MSEIIDYDVIATEYKPHRVKLLGQTFSVNTFDSALIKKHHEINMEMAADTSKTSHDAAAAQVAVFLGIDVAELASVDYRLLKRIIADILKAIYRSGESEATKQLLDKLGS